MTSCLKTLFSCADTLTGAGCQGPHKGGSGEHRAAHHILSGGLGMQGLMVTVEANDVPWGPKPGMGCGLCWSMIIF